MSDAAADAAAGRDVEDFDVESELDGGVNDVVAMGNAAIVSRAVRRFMVVGCEYERLRCNDSFVARVVSRVIAAAFTAQIESIRDFKCYYEELLDWLENGDH